MLSLPDRPKSHSSKPPSRTTWTTISHDRALDPGQKGQENEEGERVGEDVMQIGVQKGHGQDPYQPVQRAGLHAEPVQVQAREEPTDGEHAPDDGDEGNDAVKFFPDRVRCVSHGSLPAVTAAS